MVDIYHWEAHTFSAEINYSRYSHRRYWCCTSVNLKEQHLLRYPQKAPLPEGMSQRSTISQAIIQWLQRLSKWCKLCNRPSEDMRFPYQLDRLKTLGPPEKWDHSTPLLFYLVGQHLQSHGHTVRWIRWHIHLKIIGFFLGLLLVQISLLMLLTKQPG